MSDDACRYVVALPGGIAVLVFVWWIYCETRKSRAARRADAHGPVHIIVIPETHDAVTCSGAGELYVQRTPTCCAYEELAYKHKDNSHSLKGEQDIGDSALERSDEAKAEGASIR